MQIEVITRKPDIATNQPPLLFIHGILHGAWCWDKHFLPYFAHHGYHASALSLRNHGESEKIAGWRWLRIQDYVDDVAQVAAQIEAEVGQRPIVIGHSMGGLVVQKYLEKYSAPASILAASCPTHGAWQTMFRIIINQPLAFIQTNWTFNLKALAATPQRAHWAFFSKSMPKAQVQRYVNRFGDESYLVFLDMLFLALPHTRRIKSSMLVVAGADDTLFGVAEEEDTARAYNARFRSFEGVAHDMMLEQNWEAIAHHMVTWLDEVLSY